MKPIPPIFSFLIIAAVCWSRSFAGEVQSPPSLEGASLEISARKEGIGTYIVTRRLVFISGGLTHASFGGIGLGLYTGISPILSAALFAVLSAFGVEWLSKRKDMREDSAIAVFWTLGMALGIMFTFLSPGFAPDLSAYLFGNILTITWSDIALLGGLALLLYNFTGHILPL